MCTYIVNFSMGCNSSDISPQSLNASYIVGTNIKGPLVLIIQPNKITDIRPKFPLPKFCNAMMLSPRQGYLSGGIEQMVEYEDSKKVFNPHDKLKVFEGTLTKSFSKIDIEKLRTGQQGAVMKLPDMVNVRYAHSSTLLNGKLYVIGGRQYGEEDTALLSACERFNFVHNSWETVAPLRKGRSSFNCVVFKHTIYVFGGYTGKNRRSRKIEIFKEDWEAWKTLPVRMHLGVEGSIVIPYQNNSVFIFGGKTNTGNTNSVVLFNLNTLSLLHKKPTQEKCSFQKYFLNKNNIYLLGGMTDEIEVYNLDTEELSSVNDMNISQYCSHKQMTAFAQLQYPIRIKDAMTDAPVVSHSTDKIVIVGHANQPFMKIIDPNTLKVVQKPQDLALEFFEFRTTLKVNEQYIFILGGIDCSHTKVTNRCSSLHLPSDQVKEMPRMLTQRYGFPAAVKGSFAYVFGGRKLGGDDQAIIGDCERFSFETEKWEAISPMRIKRHSSFAVVIGNYIAVVGGYKGNGVLSNDIEVYLEASSRWIELERKFGLAIESMAPVEYRDHIYLFGGRTDQGDVSKVFRLDIEIKGQSKLEKSMKIMLDPVGSMGHPGSGLNIFVKKDGKALIFGSKQNNVEQYDLVAQKSIGSVGELNEKLSGLLDTTLKSYTFCF